MYILNENWSYFFLSYPIIFHKIVIKGPDSLFLLSGPDSFLFIVGSVAIACR